MKPVLAVALIAVFVSAEVPSNSYLPPPPNSRGYPQAQASAPSIIAARALDHHGTAASSSVSGFTRSSSQINDHVNQDHGIHDHGAQARFNSNEEQGYDQNAAAFARNALDDVNTGSASYNFGYTVIDNQEGADFGHHESRVESRAQGEYHVVLPDGRRQTVSYEADERGYKPQISYEDSEDLARSGYDANANNFRVSNGYHGNEQDGGHDNARSNGYN